MIGWAGVLAVAVAGGFFGAGALGLYRRKRPGAIPYATLVYLLGCLALIVAGRHGGVIPASLDSITELALLAGYVFTSLLWIGFVFAYTGRGPRLTRANVATGFFFGVVACGSTGVAWATEAGVIAAPNLARGAYLVTFFAQLAVFSLGILGVLLIARAAIVDRDLSLWRGGLLGASGVAITLLPITIGFGQFLVGGSIWTLSLAQLGFVLVLFALCHGTEGVFTSVPVAGYLGRATALETMTSPVFVADPSGRILDANRAARNAFDVRAGHPTATIGDVLGISVTDSVPSPVTIHTSSGRRRYAVTRSPIHGVDEGLIGHAYRCKDVTERETRIQRLQVLNRVVRHNLRNDLDAIRGFSEGIQEPTVDPSEAATYFDRIESIATALVERAGTVERASQLLSENPLEPEPFDFEALAGDVGATIDTADVRIDGPDSPVTVRTDRTLVESILRELLDNAVAHADHEEPSVGIVIERAEDGASVTVWDDGPGIPAHERAVLLEGEETAGKHATGIGLWLVYWSVNRLGGTLEFSERADGGSAVTVLLPDIEDRSSG